jgi:hypothetical protein
VDGIFILPGFDIPEDSVKQWLEHQTWHRGSWIEKLFFIRKGKTRDRRSGAESRDAGVGMVEH